MTAGREVTPNDAASTERLMRYWAEGPGAVKIQWGAPGDFDRCVAELGKHVGPGIVKGASARTSTSGPQAHDLAMQRG